MTMKLAKWLSGVALALVLLVVAEACSSRIERGDSESHFLRDCAMPCLGGLECVCGVCTKPCAETSECSGLAASAVCAAVPAWCSSGSRACDVACLRDDECGRTGAGLTCVQGHCREKAATDAGSGSDASDGHGSTGASTGLPDRCSLPPVEDGLCDSLATTYFHDAATGVCTPFIGCGHNANQFSTIEECEDTCHGSDGEMDECKMPTDCVLQRTGRGPGGGCGLETAESFVALNRSDAAAYASLRACIGVRCLACPPADPVTMTTAYFVPTCRAGQCIVTDLRKTAATSCATSADCHVRFGNACCGDCGGTSAIAVSSEGALSALVCGVVDATCAACDPAIPPDLVAICADGLCQLRHTGLQ